MSRDGEVRKLQPEGIPDAVGSGGRAVSLWPIRSEPYEHPETDPLGTRLRLGDTCRFCCFIIPSPLRLG
jgi:hypothetical protein